MNYILFTFIFLCVIFVYLHIYHQLKTSNDLGVIKLENPTKDELEQECDIKQPLFFRYENDNIKNCCNLNNITSSYINYYLNDSNGSPVVVSELQELLLSKKDEILTSIDNQEYIKEMMLNKEIEKNDSYLKPYLNCSSIYDLLIGGKNGITYLKYNDSCRNYMYITQGSITIRLIPPQYSSSLYCNKDYLKYKFTSPVNVWDVQDEYKKKYYKVRFVDVTLYEGDIMYIPAYWWYSIRYNKVSSILNMMYYTYTNYLSILPNIIFHRIYKIKHNREVKKNLLIKNDENNVHNEEAKSNEQTKNSEISENTNTCEL